MIIAAQASTLAAPPMSFFMSSMPLEGLMSSPPVSKQTPLPTSVTLGCAGSPQTKSIRRGAREEARPTAWIIGKFCARRSSPMINDNSAPLRRRDPARPSPAPPVPYRWRCVDEIAARCCGVRDARDGGDIDAVRRDEAEARASPALLTVNR